MDLKVLLVEDSERDAALVLRELKKGQFEATSTRVQTPEAMTAALEEQEWDVIISDYAMPSFTAMDALRTAQMTGRDLPFIVVSGTIGEDVAVAMMQAGAHDYLMKDNLPRLVPAVRRELREAERRRKGRAAEEALVAAGRDWQATFDGVNDGVTISFKVFQMVGSAPLRVRLYNLSGTLVREEDLGAIESGEYSLEWDGTNEEGQFVSPGVYLYRVLLEGDARTFVKTGTLVVLY